MERKIGEFNRIKSAYPDYICLFHCGSNYEAYSEDALRIGKCLGIDIKTCNISDSSDAIPFICFPVYDLDKNLSKLIGNGLKVAIDDATL